MWQITAFFRLLAVLLWVLVGMLLALFVRMLCSTVFRGFQRKWYCGLLAIMGIHCRYHGEAIEQVALVVSNHISWADIIVIGAKWPLVFLAKHEVAAWPVLGWLARCVGTLFIERGNGAATATAIVSAKLKAGYQVGLFPEGKTTDGLSVERFHPRIMQAAIDAGVALQPVAICYLDHGKSASEGSRISYSGTTGLVGSVWRTLSGPRITADIRVFGLISPANARQQLATTAFEVVSRHVASTLSSPKIL